MTKEARSKGACWTCRLRRKKCSEEVPVCWTCTSLALPCYGYEIKPEWADGGERQQRKAHELRDIIRNLANAKRRGKYQRLSAANSTDANNSHLGEQLVPNRVPESRNSLTRMGDEQADQMSIGTSESGSREPGVVPTFLVHELHADLLMHYLDVVFPTAFPFYEGSRGWLLLIISRTKPLYHATLCIAACHYRIQICSGQTSNLNFSNNCALDVSGFHSALAMKELRLYLEQFRGQTARPSLEQYIEVLVGIVYLISFEVLNGGDWHVHLLAAQTLLPDLAKDCGTVFPPPNEPYSPMHQKAHQFFTSVISWYHIAGSATTGRGHPGLCKALSSNAELINFENVIGCENSVVISIFDIASLQMSHANRFIKQCEIDNRARVIDNALRDTLDKLPKNSANLASTERFEGQRQCSRNGGLMLLGCASRPKIISGITRIFACAALVYLNVTTRGHNTDPLIVESVSLSIKALEALPDRKFLAVMAWPICIAGCMATGQQVEFFRQLALDLDGIAVVKSGNLKKTFEVLEECWRLRTNSARNVDWTQAMESLQVKVLLA